MLYLLQIVAFRSAFAEDSVLKAAGKDVCDASWMTEHGSTKVSLSEPFVAPDLAMSLLSTLAPARNNIASLFLPEKTLLFDPDNYVRILGQAVQHDNGIYYIRDHQTNVPNGAFKKKGSQVSAMMAVSRAHMPQDAKGLDTVECMFQSCAAEDEGRTSNGTTEHVCDPKKEKYRNKELLLASKIWSCLAAELCQESKVRRCTTCCS